MSIFDFHRPGVRAHRAGHDDPPRDAALGDAIRAIAGGTPRGDQRLVAAVVDAGRPRLAQLEAGTEWWEWTARWARTAIPIGLAASLLVAVLAYRSLLPPDDTQSPRAPSVAFAAVASMAGSEVQIVDSLVGPATHDWLLTAAVEQ
jgi:hypothetical protein